MLADSLEIDDHCIQLVFRSTETKKQQKNTHDTPFSEDVQFNSFEFSRKTLPKALRTQALTALTSNYGLVGLVQYA